MKKADFIFIAIALVLLCLLTFLLVAQLTVSAHDHTEPEASPAPSPSPSPEPSPPPLPPQVLERPYNYTHQLETIIEFMRQIIYQNIEEDEAERDFYLEYEYVMLYVLTEELLDEVRMQNQLIVIASGLVIGSIIGMAVLSKWNMGV